MVEPSPATLVSCDVSTSAWRAFFALAAVGGGRRSALQRNERVARAAESAHGFARGADGALPQTAAAAGDDGLAREQRAQHAVRRARFEYPARADVSAKRAWFKCGGRTRRGLAGAASGASRAAPQTQCASRRRPSWALVQYASQGVEVQVVGRSNDAAR